MEVKGLPSRESRGAVPQSTNLDQKRRPVPTGPHVRCNQHISPLLAIKFDGGFLVAYTTLDENLHHAQVQQPILGGWPPLLRATPVRGPVQVSCRWPWLVPRLNANTQRLHPIGVCWSRALCVVWTAPQSMMQHTGQARLLVLADNVARVTAPVCP